MIIYLCLNLNYTEFRILIHTTHFIANWTTQISMLHFKYRIRQQNGQNILCRTKDMKQISFHLHPPMPAIVKKSNMTATF